jgi:tetratricopeptide (TPR) repeat protein
MNFPLTITLFILPPCLLFSTSRLIENSSARLGYSVHPQQGKRDNLLDIIAGDTRTIIGNALLEKADAYYHGGLTEHSNCSVTTAGKDHDHDHHEDEHASGQSSAWRDPWRYLNAQLQTQAHVHLDKPEELLPWYWAACEASPHNIQALEAAAYALAQMTEKPQEALQLLEKGIRDNPYNVTLELSRGEILIKHFKNFKTAETAFLAAYQKSLHENAPKDDMLKAKALFYLGHIAKQRNDLNALQQWQQIARETMSLDLISIKNLLEIK